MGLLLLREEPVPVTLPLGDLLLLTDLVSLREREGLRLPLPLPELLRLALELALALPLPLELLLRRALPLPVALPLPAGALAEGLPLKVREEVEVRVALRL